MLLWSAPKRLDATERNSAIEVQQHKDAEQKSKSTGKELPVPPQSPNVEINIRNTPSGETNGKNHQYEIAKEQEHIDIERSLANFTRYLVYVGIAQAVILLCQAGIFLLQLCAYRKQGHILEQSLADNRRTFVVTQRPKLIVRNVVVKQPKSVHGRDPYLFEPGHPVIGQFYVANVGGSRAHIIESLCWVRALQGINLPMERPYEGEYGNNPVPICDLNPGQPITAIIGAPPDATFIPTQAQSDGIRSSDIELGMLGATRWSLYILGWIDYRDDIGIDRRTAFCRRYEPATGRFVKVNDLDYENED